MSNRGAAGAAAADGKNNQMVANNNSYINTTSANGPTSFPRILEEYGPGTGSLMSRINQMIPDLNTSSFKAGDNGNSTEDYLVKWRAAEDQSANDRRSRSILESELQSTKLMISTLAAKLELLSEQTRNENSNIRDMSRMFGQKERESRDAIDVLSRKLDLESKKVHQLVEELSRSRQNDAATSHLQQDLIKTLQEKVDQLNNKLEGYAEKSNQVGFTLNSTTNQLLLESKRNEDTIKTIKMHDLALTTLSSNFENNVEGFTRKIQMAAQDLFQRIDTEAKARKGLEDAIKQDALEFRRMIERHIAERVDSVHSYTLAQSEHDRQEIEQMASAFNAKIQRLEVATSSSQEQFASLLNQRLQLMETNILEGEQGNKRLEARIQSSLAESLQFFENLLVKRDAENEKRIKEVTKSVLAMQKAIHESIQITEKTMEAKLKAVEEVLRAEISARLETDAKLANLTQETKNAFESQQSQFTKINETLEEQKTDQSKTLTLIKSVAQQLTKSQDRWVANFESEIAKLSDSLNKQTTQFFSTINQTKTQMLQVHDEFVSETQENHAQVVLDLEEAKNESDKIKTVLGNMDAKIQDIVSEFDQKFLARSVQFDSTLEAFKIELSSRPTHSAIEDRIVELENEQEEEHKSIMDKIDSIKVAQGDLVLKETLAVLRDELVESKLYLTELCAANESRVKEATDQMQLFRNEEHLQLQEDIAAQIETLNGKQEELDQNLTKQAGVLEDLKSATSDKIEKAVENMVTIETQLETVQSILKENDEKLQGFKQDQELALQQASARDEKITALKEDVTELNEVWSKKLLDAVDKQTKVSAAISIDVKKVQDTLVSHKSTADKTTEQVNHLRDSTENQAKSQKLTTTEISKRFDEMMLAMQTQLEANARKISQLGINLESHVLQNQNDHLMIQEDVAFTKRMVSNSSSTNSGEPNQSFSGNHDDLLSQIQKSAVLLEETRRDVDDFAKKAQQYERSISTRFIEINEASEKQALEYQSQVKHLSDLVTKTQEQFDEKFDDSQKDIDHINREIKVVKSDIGKLELDNVRIQGELGRLSRDNSSPNEEINTLIKPISSKLERLQDRISNLEESVAETGSPPKTPKARRADVTTPGQDDQGTNSIYKPAPVNIKSGSRGTPRSASKSDSVKGEDSKPSSPGKVPLQHTPSSVEF